MPRNQGTSRKGKPGRHDRESGMGKALQRAQGQRYRPKANGRSQDGGGMAMQVGVESIDNSNNQEETNRTKSVLELQDLDDFLQQASLANREFVSEKEGLVVLDSTGQLYRPSTVQWADKRPDFTFTELSVPRRPAWNESTTAQELQALEQEAFLEWRRSIAHKEEELLRSQSSTAATPFEKNLEVWRQLWRVLERSACLLQLVDARNPLFYLSQDLREYANSLGKPMMVLVNKSDYLSATQRAMWRDYLQSQGWNPVVFFSAATEQAKLDNRARQRQRQEANRSDAIDSLLHKIDGGFVESHQEQELELVSADGRGVDVPLNRQQLLDTLLAFARQHDCQPDIRYDNRIQFGMVGFPNVGKSSVINVLMGSSKHTHGLVRVGVAAQPGKTKHFQTLLLTDAPQLMLCDCPGLVFPSFVSNTADLIAAGVYPIAQMRDHAPVINLICHRIPREILNAHYGIQIPLPTQDQQQEQHRLVQDDNDQIEHTIPPPTEEEFLRTLCVARGMMAASSGVPDYTRAARMVTKEYATGKLLYCHAPPSLSSDQDKMFGRETVQTALDRTDKLKVKLAKQQKQLEPLQQQQQEQTRTVLGEEEDLELDLVGTTTEATATEEDDLIVELLTDGTAVQRTSTATAISGPPSRRSKRKGGRKKKNRCDDPYGCHSFPDADIMDTLLMMDGANETIGTTMPYKGVTVNAGKYGRKDYTRPTGHGFTNASTTTTGNKFN